MEGFVTAFLGVSKKVHFRKKMTSQMAEGFFSKNPELRELQGKS